MKKVFQFLNKSWKDPVWSKVISAVIIGSALYTSSLVKDISFVELINTLKSTYLEVSYLTLLIITCLFLVLVLLLIYMGIITFQVRHFKVSKPFKKNEFDAIDFLSGTWLCQYKRLSNGWGGEEFVKILNGNNYVLNNEVIYILTDIVVDDSKREISWTKTRYVDGVKHSRENLTIISAEELIGSDDMNLSIRYKRTKA